MKFLLSALLLCLSLPLFSGPLVVYGADSRVNTPEHRNWRYKSLASSVAAMIPNDALIRSGINRGGVLNFYKSNLRTSTNLCPNERFGLQPDVALCTGFLIGPRTLVTAGHCVQNQEDCNNNSWAFDYTAKTDFDRLVSLDRRGVYKCSKIIKSVLNEENENDFAVIQLDRPVNRRPLRLRAQFASTIFLNEQVFVVGHPSGLPQKIADSAWVTKNYGGKGKFFTTNLDTFGGNSGSPVFNAKTLEVEGILVRGHDDYEWDEKSGCTRPVSCRLHPSKCSGEHVTRITEIYKAFRK